ncbi:hypothetical protein [Nonomuraea insulae]|uniref:Uncharacterized protein n=1 Tax=Nonomuraea insulae TaxID=1616787 RepID=A0ABW1D2V4_9ACTN
MRPFSAFRSRISAPSAGGALGESFAVSKLGLATSFDADFEHAFTDTANYQRTLRENAVAAGLRAARKER